MIIGTSLIAARKWVELSGIKLLPMLAVVSFMVIAFSLLLIVTIALLCSESFNYTHYPMRFNRKTRMVHVFLPFKKGRIFTVPWDALFFTCSTKKTDLSFNIIGHKLSEDGNTILETFMLPCHSDWTCESRYLQWEFVRQYMEGDDRKVAELANMISEVPGVAERRENVYESYRQARAIFSGQSYVLAFLFSPLTLMATIGRQIAMWTSKKPRWPDEIEATCQVSPDDPNLRDRKHLVPRREVIMPDLSAYAGR